MKATKFETIFEALAAKTGLRPSAIEKWCVEHGIDPFLEGGTIVSNAKAIVNAVLNDDMPSFLKPQP